MVEVLQACTQSDQIVTRRLSVTESALGDTPRWVWPPFDSAAARNLGPRLVARTFNATVAYGYGSTVDVPQSIKEMSRRRLRRRLLPGELTVLRALGQPTAMEDETAELKWVRPVRPATACRTIWCGGAADLLVFTGRAGVVVALFAADEAVIGDVWYGGVGARADALIEQWKREVGYDR